MEQQTPTVKFIKLVLKYMMVQQRVRAHGVCVHQCFQLENLQDRLCYIFYETWGFLFIPYRC